MPIGKHASSNQPRKPRLAPWIALGAVVVLAVGSYAAGAAYFSTHFPLNTRIGDVDVSLMTADEAHDAVKSAADGYTLALGGTGFSLELSADDVAAKVDASGIDVSAAGTPLLWVAHVLPGGGTQLDLPVSYDEGKVDELVRAAVEEHNAAYTAESDEQVVYFPAEDRFVAASYLESAQIDADDAVLAADEAIRSLATEATVEAKGEQGPVEDVDPAVEQACEKADELTSCDIPVNMGGSEVLRINRALAQEWVTFSDELEPSLDMGAVDAWAREKADELTTLGKERTYTRPDGKQVTVAAGERSEYGWVVDADAFASRVADAVEGKSSEAIEVPCTQQGTGYNAQTGADWGAYIDVDISEQHVRYYDADGNLLWESGCVTGNPNLGNDTPQGVYQVNNKLQDIVLRGAADPETGEPSYESPVSYWIAFIGSTWGLHDASWQAESRFGDPDAYLTHGSHGCVNLPPDKAAELYELVEVGDVVVVHE